MEQDKRTGTQVGGKTTEYQELFSRLDTTLNEAHAPPSFLGTLIDELAPLVRMAKSGTVIPAAVWSRINGCIHDQVAEGIGAQNVGAAKSR